jgi:hypothetical protein
MLTAGTKDWPDQCGAMQTCVGGRLSSHVLQRPPAAHAPQGPPALRRDGPRGRERAAHAGPRPGAPPARPEPDPNPSPDTTHPQHIHAAAVQQVRAQQHLAAHHVLQQRAALRRGQAAERRAGEQERDDVRPPRRPLQLRAVLLEARLRARAAPPGSCAGGRCAARAGSRCVAQGCGAARSTAGPRRCAVRGAARSLAPRDPCARETH